jgi:hypothetical protein
MMYYDAMRVFYRRLQRHEQSGFFLKKHMRVLKHSTATLGPMTVGLPNTHLHSAKTRTVIQNGPFILIDGYIYNEQLYLRFCDKASRDDQIYYSHTAPMLMLSADHNLETLLRSVLDDQLSLIDNTSDLITHLSTAETRTTIQEVQNHDKNIYAYF